MFIIEFRMTNTIAHIYFISDKIILFNIKCSIASTRDYYPVAQSL